MFSNILIPSTKSIKITIELVLLVYWYSYFIISQTPFKKSPVFIIAIFSNLAQFKGIFKFSRRAFPPS